MSKNARSRNWKLRHVRHKDSWRVVTQVLARMVPDNRVGQEVPSPKEVQAGDLIALFEGEDSRFLIHSQEGLRSFSFCGWNGAWDELPPYKAESWANVPANFPKPTVVAVGLTGQETSEQILDLVKKLKTPKSSRLAA